MTQEKNLLFEILGWYGMIAVIVAYGLVSYSIINGDSALFQLLNITGSFWLLTIAWVKKVYQSVALNIVWAIIGIIALAKILL